MNMIDTDVGLFGNAEEAEALREALVHQGFDSVVVIERDSYYSVVAQVQDPDPVLKAAGECDVEGAIACPSCQGRLVSYPARPQASPTAAGLQKVVDAVGGAVAGTELRAHCNSCGYEWVPEAKPKA